MQTFHEISIKTFSFVELNESLQTYLTLPIRITMGHHLSDLLWSYLLSQLLSCRHQVLLGYIPFSILIEILENSLNILLSIRLARSYCHQLHKLLESDLTSIVSIENRHCNVHKRSARFVSAIISDSLTKIHRSQHAVKIVI